MSKFSELLDQKAQEQEKSLERYFSRNFDSPDQIIDSVKYSLFSPGKKIRPILVTETANLLGYDPEIVQPLADAIEMIHTYSLIHDDLPAMDDDELRRGKPTNHIVFGEDMAVLAGDSLLNMAMERVLEGVPEKKVRYYLEAAKILFYMTGVNGLIGGQTADILSDGYIDHKKLAYIHTHKTGALICASVLCGAVPFLGRNDPRVKALYHYANCLGKAFQIVDDILDVEGNEKELGKKIGSDKKNNRGTYVSIYGIGAAHERVKELKEEALMALDLIGGDSKFLKDLTVYVCDRTK